VLGDDTVGTVPESDITDVTLNQTAEVQAVPDDRVEVTLSQPEEVQLVTKVVSLHVVVAL
jgi:hypothetical protein